MMPQLPDDLRRYLDKARARVSSSSRIWVVPSITYESELVYKKALILGGTISPFFLMKREPGEKGIVPPWIDVAAGAVVGNARLLFLPSVEEGSESVTLAQWVPLLESLAKACEGLVLVTNTIQNKTVLATLLINNCRNVMQSAVVSQGDWSEHQLEKMHPKALHRKGGLSRGAGKNAGPLSQIDREGLPLFDVVWVRKDASVAIPLDGSHEWDDLLSEVAVISVGGYSYDDCRQRFESVAHELASSADIT